MALFAAFADFGPVSGSEAGENSGREREECGPGQGHGPDAEVRRLPQEPPTTRGNWRDQARKNPNRERLGFCYWWSRGELNPRPRALRRQFYMCSRYILRFDRGACLSTGPALASHYVLGSCLVTRQIPILCR